MPRRFFLLAAALLFAGCVERTMTIKTDPPGALVYLNDQELGRTPFTRDFTWYGNYDVEIRKDGYRTIKTRKWVIAPVWGWAPFDLVAELQPATLKDHKELFYKMQAVQASDVEPGPLMTRAEELKGQLQSSEFTRTKTPATAPSTRPATQPSH